MVILRSRPAAALAGVLFTVPGGPGVPASTPPPANEAAYAIYNVLLTAWVGGDRQATVSVVRFTHIGPTDCLANVERSPRWTSAVADLTRQNASAQLIEPKFSLPFRYELADTMEEVGGLRPPPPGKDPIEFLEGQMARLEEMGRQHFSQVQLSAPGISADGQLAIVYVSNSFSGAFHIVRRSGAKWKVRRDPKCGWIA